MRKKCNILSVSSFVIALAIFAVTYYLVHYMGAGGAYQEEPLKPFVTLLFGIWGVMFLFSAVMSFVIGHIFFVKE